MRLSVAAVLFAAMGLGIGMPTTNTAMPNNTVTHNNTTMPNNTATHNNTAAHLQEVLDALEKIPTWDPYVSDEDAYVEFMELLRGLLTVEAELTRQRLEGELHPGPGLNPTANNIVTRANTGPPRNRKVAEQMKSLPECWQTCFRQENGKVGVNIYEWDLDKFCWYPTWIRTNTWILYHIRPCWKRECKNHKHEIKGAARRWMQETCPRYK
ncbi:hypothetical protein VPNG_05821 [Cytospora leucostoma]|uniref:Uncharacterized protein n=1 Tax=Cytospora leucostoma TaxID=1230097 RepID=A0A423X0J2_9PEZI|nr:hypothetical protein VPNG_05821 [Cytospora leucostoma]